MRHISPDSDARKPEEIRAADLVLRIERPAPSPEVYGPANCLASVGVPPDEWRAHVRKLGCLFTEVGRDVFVVAADYLAAIKSRAKVAPMPVKTRKPKPAPSPAPLPIDDPDALLEAAGFSRRRGAR